MGIVRGVDISGEEPVTTEYGEAKKKTRETNPLGLSNAFHMVVGVVNLLAGCGLAYLLTQGPLQLDGGFASALSVSATLMVLGVSQIARSWKDDRFRIHPEDIGDIAVTEKFAQGGQPNVSGYVQDVLNNGVVPPKTPDGAILNKLYGWLPKLEFAPEVVRWHAETQALRIVRLIVAVLGFALAAVFAKGGVFAWLVPLYLVLAVRPWSVIRSLRQGQAGVQQMARPAAPTPLGSVVVLLFSVFVPILIPVLLAPVFPAGVPGPPWSTMAVVAPTIIAMATMLVASAVFLMALKTQTASLGASAVRHRVRKDLEIPNLGQGLLDEIAQQLPWPRKVLYRNAASGHGEFHGQLLVETEPTLDVVGAGDSRLGSIRTAWNESGHRLLVALGAFGALTGIAATSTAVLYALGWGVPLLLAALALFSTSQFSLFAARGLWNRIDFRSVVYSLYYKGVFRQAQRVVGNAMTGSGTLTETTTAVDHVDFRVSVAEMRSVAFAKDGARYIQSVDLKPAECDRIISIVEDFNREVLDRKVRAYSEEGVVRQLVQRDSRLSGPAPAQAMLAPGAALDPSTPSAPTGA
jgi:hypothetical protein